MWNLLLSCLSNKGITNYITDYFSAPAFTWFPPLGAQADHQYPPEPGHAIHHAFLCRINTLVHTLLGEGRKGVYSSGTSGEYREVSSVTIVESLFKEVCFLSIWLNTFLSNRGLNPSTLVVALYSFAFWLLQRPVPTGNLQPWHQMPLFTIVLFPYSCTLVFTVINKQ